MPDTTISALTDGTTANSTDRIPVARDAGGGTFNNRYVTPGYIGTTLLGSGTALTGATVTTSSPVLNLTQTWNDGAGGTVTFTGLKFNATDTASASGSLLLDLQVGGTSKFYVNKIGDIYSNGVRVSKYVNSSRLDLAPGVTSGLLYDSATTLEIGANASSAIISAGYQGSGQFRSYRYIIGASTEDLFLTRANTATLQLGAADTTGTTAPTPQFLRVQSWSSSTNNNQLGADFTIQGSRGTGTGAGGSIIFQVAPAGNSSNGVQNAYSTALTIASDRSATFTGSVSASGQISSTTGLVVSGSGNFWINSNTGNISWGSSFDVALYRDAANTLALRNSTNAQLFRVYSTYNGTNDAYGAIGAAVNLDGTAGDANTLYIGSQKKGSPTALTKLAIQVDGTTKLDFGVAATNKWTFGGAANTGLTIDLSTAYQVTFSTPSSTGIVFSPSDNFRVTSALSTNFNGNVASFGYNGIGFADFISNPRITFRNGYPVDALPSNFSIIGNNAYSAASTNIIGGNLSFIAGNGASGSASAANGGNVLIDGGLGYGTGVNGRLIIGSTNSTITAFGGTTSSFPALKRSTTTLQVRLADDSAFGSFQTGGFSGGAPTIKTANYTQLEADYSLIFNGTGSITLTLLAAATYPGKILYVKTIAAQTVVSASSNVKPIDTDTAGTAILAATAGKWAMLQSDGTDWVIMAQG